MQSNWSTGIHSVDDKVLKELQNKHPDPSPIKEGALLHGPINRVLPSYLGTIDEAMVLKAGSRVPGDLHNWTPNNINIFQVVANSKKKTKN